LPDPPGAAESGSTIAAGGDNDVEMDENLSALLASLKQTIGPQFALLQKRTTW